MELHTDRSHQSGPTQAAFAFLCAKLKWHQVFPPSPFISWKQILKSMSLSDIWSSPQISVQQELGSGVQWWKYGSDTARSCISTIGPQFVFEVTKYSWVLPTETETARHPHPESPVHLGKYSWEVQQSYLQKYEEDIKQSYWFTELLLYNRIGVK